MNNPLAKTDIFVPFKTNPNYIKAICDGKSEAAEILKQAIYWSNSKKGLTFYKSDKEFAEEVIQSIRTFQTLKKFLRDKGFLKVEVIFNSYGVRRSHYTVDFQKIQDAINHYVPSKSAAIKNAICGMIPRILRDDTANLAGCTLSYNTTDITSSFSKVTPAAEAPVVEQQEREKEDFQNIYYATGTPVQNTSPPEKPNGIIAVDLRSITEPMIEIWNGLCPGAKAEAKDFMFGLHSRFLDSFNSSLDEWEQYCRKIASSKFLMGERPMSNGRFYKLALTWALSLKNIADVKNGKYDTDRIIPQTQQEIIAEKESIIDRINNSHEDSWVINLRKALLNKLGDSVYKSWLSDLKIQEKEDKIFLVASSSFRADHIEQHYCDDILGALKAQGINKTIYFYDQLGLPNINAIPSRSAINSNEDQSTIAISLQSLANGLRSKNSLRKPMPIEEPCELVGKYDYSTQPSIRNALIKASEKFANGA